MRVIHGVGPAFYINIGCFRRNGSTFRPKGVIPMDIEGEGRIIFLLGLQIKIILKVRTGAD
jgi:hypothetical protein